MNGASGGADLETRLRRALTAGAAGTPVTRPVATWIIEGVRRRRVRRRNRLVTGGCALVLVLALVVVVGAERAPGGTTTRTAASAASAGSRTPPRSAAPSVHCVADVVVGSAPATCAGTVVPSATASSNDSPGYLAGLGRTGFGVQHTTSQAGTTSASPPAAVTVRVGQRITVDLHRRSGTPWCEPVAITATAPASGELRRVGTLFPSGRDRRVTFLAEHPGTVTVNAAEATGSPPTCSPGPVAWTLTVTVEPR